MSDDAELPRRFMSLKPIPDDLHGVSPATRHLYHVLDAQADPVTAVRLEELTGYHHATIYRSMSDLIAEGHATEVRMPTDASRTYYTLG